VEFENLSEIQAALGQVRKDSSRTDWVALSYAGPKAQKVSLLGHGEGGVEELMHHFKPDNVCYCLVRQTDQIDDSITVKFAFINWIGDNTPRMQKAKVSIHRGGVTNLIGVSL